MGMPGCTCSERAAVVLHQQAAVHVRGAAVGQGAGLRMQVMGLAALQQGGGGVAEPIIVPSQQVLDRESAGEMSGALLII